MHGNAEDACWNQRQRTVIRLADELHHTSAVSDELFGDLALHFDDKQILELTATAGWYHTIAYIIAVAGVAPEPWAALFPAPDSMPRQP